MNHVLQLKLSQGLQTQKTKRDIKTPGDIGASIFQNLLKKSSQSSFGKKRRLSFFKGQESNHSVGQKKQDPEINTLLKLNQRIRQLGVPISQLTLPDTALPQLKVLLKNQGLSKGKIDQLIQSARDKDGSLHAGLFIPYLIKRDNEIDMGTENHKLVIQSQDVPRLEEVLFKMGLGAGKIKELMEKSINPDGDVVLDRLSDNLAKFRGPTSEKDLISLLEQFDIRNKPMIMNPKGLDPDLKNEFMNLSKAPSQDIQNSIKQNITALLSKKGIPPQEIKSFLENLNVQFAKSTLQTTTKNSTESQALLNQLTISTQTAWRKGVWNEKILAILQGERVLITKHANKGRAQGPGDMRLNLSALTHGEPKPKADLFKEITLNNKTAHLGNETQGPGNMRLNLSELKHGEPKSKADLFQEILLNDKTVHAKNETQRSNTIHNSKGIPQDKGGLGVDHTATKVEAETLRTTPIDSPRNTVNLPHPLPKIVERMLWMIRAGEQKGRLTITPPELGRLNLNLSIKHGHLQAHLSAENIMVKELIDANLGQLRQQLSDQGFVVDKIEVMVSMDDKPSKENDMWAGHGRRRKSSSRGKDSDEEIEALALEPQGIRPSTLEPYQINVLA